MVALPGVGHMPAKGEDEQAAGRVFYLAATRATQRLVIWVGGGATYVPAFAEHSIASPEPAAAFVQSVK